MINNELVNETKKDGQQKRKYRNRKPLNISCLRLENYYRKHTEEICPESKLIELCLQLGTLD